MFGRSDGRSGVDRVVGGRAPVCTGDAVTDRESVQQSVLTQESVLAQWDTTDVCGQMYHHPPCRLQELGA